MPRYALPAIAAALALIAVAPDLSAERIDRAIAHLGPLAVVGLVTLAIVVSPIPSGPVAMAAGAAFGAVEGGLMTALGACLGSSVAFAMSRRLGRAPLAASSNRIAEFVTRPRSETALTCLIFASRLVPFVSFDAVSYVAGLTPVRYSRFVLATLAGTTPVCIGFAALGGGASEAGPALLIAASCITLILPAALLCRRFSRRGTRTHP